MHVEVIGKKGWEQSCTSYGCVVAQSFQKAVEQVFSNRLIYPRIITLGQGQWIVHHMDRLPLSTGAFSTIQVRARKVKGL